eukprot:TRINITY_DN51373_c0_g1_i1.p1 TRINITY_DN51373_c0_g1~~TRINITY_DN51373_c0_g1_i1.p1  ORF type:complete len:174 (-),score=37.97 TRINITY_DN51373_c0_g1_i1:258-779(-)
MGLREALFGKSEEEKTAIDKLEDQIDDCCPSLSWSQRLIGFGVCCGLGLLLTLGSFFRFKQCIQGDCTSFAVIYTIGNVVAIIGSFFLSGPCKQLKSCFEMGRLCATFTFLFFMTATLVVALVDGIESSTRVPLVILSCICQLVAYVWYCLSYIPFAHTCIISACKGFFPCFK